MITLPSVPANWALVDFAPCQFLMTHGAENVSIFALIDGWNQDCIKTNGAQKAVSDFLEPFWHLNVLQVINAPGRTF